MAEKEYICSIDQGTSSTRFMIFDRSCNIIIQKQIEHTQIYPQSSWVEHDADEIWSCTKKVVIDALTETNISAKNLAAIGITTQRETTVVWNKYYRYDFIIILIILITEIMDSHIIMQ